MSWTAIADAAGLLCLLCGALLCLFSAIGLLRLDNLLLRMQAGAKPQVLGLFLVLVGVGLRVRSGLDIGMLVLVGLFQMVTIPVSAHLVSRAQYGIGKVPPLSPVDPPERRGSTSDPAGSRSLPTDTTPG